jgi:hypothetical protein
MKFTLASPEHEPEIRLLHAGHSMHGNFCVTEQREPDFFHCLAIQGKAEALAMLDDSGRVVGMGTRSSSAVWLGGVPGRLGYLGALRMAPSYGRGLNLARAFRFLRRRHEEDPGCRFYLTTIFAQNHVAKRLLTSGRAGLPRYLEAGELRCHALSPVRAGRISPCDDLVMDTATIQTLPEMLVFLSSEGAKTNFFPILEMSDFGSARLRDLHPEDCVVARSRGDGKIVGAMAIWDQSRFRQFPVRLSGAGAMLWPLARWLLGLDVPRSGQALPLRHACFICIRDHDPTIFANLLRSAILGLPRGTILTAGFHVRHPLYGTLARLSVPFVNIRSHVYLACWEDAVHECRQILNGGGHFHIDPSTL